MTLPTTKIILAGGGTGGHLYPAIAIANRLRELLSGVTDTEIIMVGTKRGIEYRLRDQLGYPLHLINMRGIVRAFSLKNLTLPFVVVGALAKARALLRSFQPDIVIGTGGYVAWPILRMAIARGIPCVMQEQNSYPGIVTRQLAPRAQMTYLGFGRAADYLRSGTKTMVTGNPVRREISQAKREAGLREFNLDESRRTILVMGGSQGARAINQAVLKSLKANGLDDDIQLLWQTGKREYKDVTSQLGNRASGCTLFPFAKDMSLVYAAADLAIARSGALTLAELQVCRIPSMLIPFPFAAEDHQRKNAEVLVDKGQARMIIESELAEHDLLAEATTLINSTQYEEMRRNLSETGDDTKASVDVIAEHIISLIQAKHEGTV
jgi:UDP-N-acetylglucosamine--N-acetylmuramyl-(pentapeptide) pyrophosphoryl-undecaprenol N-acetylglucosamine transferase